MFSERISLRYSLPEEHHGCESFGRMVLHSTPWCSSLALGLIWRCQVGCWGWGFCRRQRHWKTGAAPKGEGTLILNCWSLIGLAITRWQVNIHLCVKDVISLRVIVPSELSEPLSYRWRGNHHWSKSRTNCKAIVNPQVEEFSCHR